MGEKAAEAGEKKWDTNSPPDSPFITDPLMQTGLSIPMEYVRRMEEAQRLYALHDTQQRAAAYAYRQSSWTVGMQCLWFGVGGWLTARGYKYADPVQSFVSGFTSNRVLCRLFTPISMVGLTIVTLTAFQLPWDVGGLLAARNALFVEEMKKVEALEMRRIAFHEGKSVSDRLTEEERRAFEGGMAESRNSPA